MEFKKEFLGQNIFVKSLNRNVVVNYDNLAILSRFDFLFIKEKASKNDSVTASKPKSNKRRAQSRRSNE